MQKMKTLLNLQDYFGIVPSLRIHGQVKYQNFIRGFLSLIINTSCIVLTVNFLIEFFSHNNPSLNTVSISTNITLSSDNLNIAFGIMNRQYNVINDPTIFTIQYKIIYSYYYYLNFYIFNLRRSP